MGFFDNLFGPSEEELASARKRMENSAAAKFLANWLTRQFSDLNGEKIRRLREGYHYCVTVEPDQFVLALVADKHSLVNTETAVFASLGYENLPNKAMAGALENFLMDTIAQIPHIRVSGRLIYAGSGIKQGW